MKPIVKIHNTETNEVIDREMTDEEYANYLTHQQLIDDEATLQETERSQAATDKAALLERLGITEEEARLLLS